MGSLFFTAGALFGHYFLFPMTFQFLYTFGGKDMQFLPRIGEYWSFYSWFLLGLGLVFQIPVIIFVLARLGLVTAGLPPAGLEVRRPLLLRRLGRHHADPRHGDPDGARGADDRALPARRAGGVLFGQKRTKDEEK